MALVETTKEKALKEGKSLLQSLGYNGFSFQHIADALGMRKQSLYVHFKSKEAFGDDLLETYLRSFKTWTAAVADFGPEERLSTWFEAFYKFASDDLKYCPLAALASDYNSLPKSMQRKLHQVYEMRRHWVIDVVIEGQRKNVFRKDFKAENLAQIAITFCFGCQQVARLANDAETIHSAKKDLMRILKGT